MLLSRGLFSLTLIITLLAPASVGGMARARKGRLLAFDGETLERVRRFNGAERGDEFGSAISFDVVPIKERAAMMIGAPGTDDGTGRLLVVDEKTRETILTVEAGNLGDGIFRLGQSVADLGHFDSTAVHWLVSAPGLPPEPENQKTASADREPVTPLAFILEPRGEGFEPRARLEGEDDSLFGWRATIVDEQPIEDSHVAFFAVAAPLEDRNGSKVDAGAVHLFDAETGERVWSRKGRRKGGHFGYALEALGDVDEDGFTDLLVGEPTGQNGRPRASVYLLSGRTGRILHRIRAPREAELFGFAVDAFFLGPGGELDLIVGAPATDPDGLEDAGSVYVFEDVLDVRARRPPRRLDGSVEDEWFGVALTHTPDLDGDDVAELVVTSLMRHRRARRDLRGGVSFLSGATGELIEQLRGRRGGDHFGVALFHRFTDLNDDGVFEYLASVTREPIPFIPE